MKRSAVPFALDVQNLTFTYASNPVLSVERMCLGDGDSAALIGPSGCGKTTLLHVIAGLLRPSTGSVRVCGEALHELSPGAADRFRGRHLGIVFQRLHLLPALPVLENVLLAQRLARQRPDPAAARSLLAALGVEGLERRKPATLSQGQAQRVAIARALIHRPKLVLADEPTSALDDGHASTAITLLREQARLAGAALLVVTHDQRIRGTLDREFDLGRPT
jgi:ABC-type lipoprotein export system ATPase subunit